MYQDFRFNWHRHELESGDDQRLSLTRPGHPKWDQSETRAKWDESETLVGKVRETGKVGLIGESINPRHGQSGGASERQAKWDYFTNRNKFISGTKPIYMQINRRHRQRCHSVRPHSDKPRSLEPHPLSRIPSGRIPLGRIPIICCP